MQLTALFLVASFVSTTIAAPVTQNIEERSSTASRFAANENQARDTAEANEAVINSRFIKYENEKRDDPEKAAVINSRFIKYENEKRDDPEETAVINSRFIKYENE